MINRRKELFNGNCAIPIQIAELVNPTKDNSIQILIEEFFQSIFTNFLKEKTTNTLIWFDKFNNPDLFNQLLTHLTKAGWITSIVNSSYAFITMNETKLLKWLNKEEINQIKFEYKFKKYRLDKNESIINNVVKINNTYKKTGLIRNGFMKAGNNVFKYDTRFIEKYYPYIAKNLMKGLTNSTKDITYQEIILELLYYYTIPNNEYTMGNCYIDSRGRAIYECSKKILNPVSHKDARALLICKPKPITNEGLNAVYASISELLGYRGRNIHDKIMYGQEMYISRFLPDLEEMILFDNFEDLHIRIWLERIYENLEHYETKGWYVPISLDAQSSILQFIGILTNDINYMKGTNLIKSKEFQDIWSRPYCSRTHVKKAMTPQLYGSGQVVKALWDKNKLDYDQIQLNKMSQDINTGIYASANNFKNFIINNCNPKETITVNSNNEIFTVECNKFQWQYINKQDYYIYDSKQNMLKKVSKQSCLIPDLKQFKRFFVTCLCHNLDSQIANIICEKLDWCLSNHDDWTIHPNSINKLRHIYTTWMFDLYKRRKQVLKDYFTSIGIIEDYEEQTHEKIITKFSPYCLK
jgi:hypothetical protein